VKEDDFQKVVNLINHRPRKSLDYRTPREVFFGASEPVALQISIGESSDFLPFKRI
jgi:hypothetical protein